MSDEIVPILYRLEGKVDSLSDEVKRHFQDDKESFAEVRSGLRAVEKKTYWLTGIIGAAAFIFGKLTGKY